MVGFGHEKLEVYQAAIEFVAVSAEIIAEMDRGTAHLADQLHRAATSIPLNIAEGAGEFSRRDKARFYRMALRSGTECAALLDILSRLSLATPECLDNGREILDSIVAMLTRMVRNLGSQSGAGGGGVTG